MKKILFVIALTLFTLSASMAQEKKGCNPSACKPGDTKVEAAAVITDLRNNLSTFKSHVSSQNLLISDTNVQVGGSETESLQIIAQEMNVLEKALGKPVTDFNGMKEAKLVRKLQSTLKALSR